MNRARKLMSLAVILPDQVKSFHEKAGSCQVGFVVAFACGECLMPPEYLAKFFLAAVRGVTTNVARVAVHVNRTPGGGQSSAGGKSCKLFPGGDLPQNG